MFAQTVLSAGDIAFIGHNSDGVDGFAFVLLKEIDAATTINFTDQGWNDGTGFDGSFSGEATFTWTSGASMTPGVIVTINTNNPNLSASLGSVSGQTPVFSVLGDQLFAFQGSVANPTLIAGLNSNESATDANWSGSATNNQTSALPDVLTNGVNAIRLHTTGSESDNWQFTGDNGSNVISGTPAQIAAIVNTIANWSTNNTTEFTPVAKTGLTFTVMSAVNAAPTATPPATPIVAEDANNVALSNAIQVTDADGNDQTVTFTVTGGIVTLGTGPTFGGGGNGAASFTAAGTLAAINTALDAATFTPTPNLNGTNAGTILFTTNDGLTTSAPASVTFNITAVPDDPAIVLGSLLVNYTEGNSATTLNTSLTVTDADGDNITAATVTITGAATGDVLAVGTPGPYTPNYTTGSGTGVLTLSGTGSVAEVQTALRSVTYRNTGDDPTNGNSQNTRNVDYAITDATMATGSSNPDLGILVTGLNDDPAIATLPSDISVVENTASNVDLSAATFGDVDAAINNVSLTITAGTGFLTASSGGSVTVSGSGTATLTLTGPAANIDAFLNTASNIQFTGPMGTTGNNASTLTLSANDGGNSGTGGGGNVSLGTVNLDIDPAIVNPTIPVVSHGPPIICSGGSALLSWTGDLNDATTWHVYTGSCGGTLVSSTIFHSALVATVSSGSITYFVRGEGGGVTPGSCGSHTITVTPREDASFSYSAASYLTTGTDPTPTITGVSGGDFTSSPVGLSINSSSGMIDVSASTPGMYTVNYQTPGLCSGNENRAVEIIAPAVTSVTVPSNDTYILGENLDFTVNFNEDITVVTTGGTPQVAVTIGSTIRQAAYVSGSGSGALLFRYTVQAGDLDMDGVSVGALSTNGGTLQDPAGNNAVLTLNSVGVTNAVLVDGVVPTLTSVTLSSDNSTDNQQATTGDVMTLAFTADDDLNAAPVVGLSIGGTSVTATVNSASAPNYTATYTLLGTENEGVVTFTIDFTDDVGNSGTQVTATTNGSSVEADLNDPKVTSFTRKTPIAQSTNADMVTYLATFSEDVVGVDMNDFRAIGVTGTSIAVSQVSASTYDVQVSGGNLPNYNGLMALNFNAPTITDLAGNTFPHSEPAIDELYSIDNRAPATTSFARKTPANEITSADILIFSVTFDTDVTGVDMNDFAVTGPTGASIDVAQITASTYTVEISGGDLASLNGTVGLNFNSPTITDIAGNDLPNTEPVTDETYQVDNSGPGIISFTRKNPTDQNTNADQLTFLATFSEDVQNVDVADFSVTGPTGASISVTPVTASTYDVQISGGDLAALNGTVGINVAAGVTIADLTGNSLPRTEPGTDDTYILDNIAPTLTSSSPVDDATDVGLDADITLSFDTDIQFGTGNIQLIDLDDGSSSITIDAASPGSLASISGNVLTINPLANLRLNVDYAVQVDAAAITDQAGNAYGGISDNTTLNFRTINVIIDFASAISSAAESVSNASIEVNLSQSSTLTTSVDYTVTGTATGGSDYTLVDGTLDINAGLTSGIIEIGDIIDDAILEADETVIVTISNPVNGALGSVTTHTYTIVDNDQVDVSLSSATVNEDAGTVAITLTADIAVQGGFSVDVNSTDDSATTGDGDYTAVSSETIAFVGIAGEMQTINIAIGVDNKVEANERFFLGLSNAVSPSGNASDVSTSAGASVTINNDDNRPIVVSGQVLTVIENTHNDFVVGTILATDLDAGTSFGNWTIVSGNDDGIFALNPSTGQLSIGDSTNLDREVIAADTLTITVDDGVNVSEEVDVVINVTDVNDINPIIQPVESVCIDEEVSNGSIVLGLSATDGDATITTLSNWIITSGNDDGVFEISSLGQVTIADATKLDRATTSSYSLMITVGDGVNTSEAITAVVNINENADFAYDSASYCSNGTDTIPIITGTMGGVFSATPAGLMLNTASGEIDVSMSMAGTYDVKYKTSGICPDSMTVALEIKEENDATFSYPSTIYDASGDDPMAEIVGDTGGVFTSMPAGLIINSATGEIDLSMSVPQTYTITYTTQGECPESEDVSLTIIEAVITGLNTLCPNIGGVAYSILGSDVITNYNWSYSGTGVTIQNNGSADVSLTVDATVTDGELTATLMVGEIIVGEASFAIEIGSPTLCELASCDRASIFIDAELIDLLESIDFYKASDKIESNAVIPSDRRIELRSGGEINLYPNFTVESEGNLLMQIESCISELYEISNRKE